MNWIVNLVTEKRVKGFDELVNLPLRFNLADCDARLLRFSFNKCSVSFELLIHPGFFGPNNDVREIVAYMQCYAPSVGFLHVPWGCFAPIDHFGVFRSRDKFVVNLSDGISIECKSIIFRCKTVRTEKRLALDRIYNM